MKHLFAALIGIAFCAAASAEMKKPDWFMIGSNAKGEGLYIDFVNVKPVQQYRGWHFFVKLISAQDEVAAKAAWEGKGDKETRSEAVNKIVDASSAETVDLWLNCDNDSYHFDKDDPESVKPGSPLSKLDAEVCPSAQGEQKNDPNTI